MPNAPDSEPFSQFTALNPLHALSLSSTLPPSGAVPENGPGMPRSEKMARTPLGRPVESKRVGGCCRRLFTGPEVQEVERCEDRAG